MKNPKPETRDQKPKKMYVLGMFPYPSGAGLHVGHVRIYTACDVMVRYFKAKGHEVLHPMGWDAFGLPAENAAIKFKTNPMEMVPKNQDNFKNQLKNLEMSFDWSRELSTTDPTYYGLTQWLFLKLYEKGLVYREKVPINWCPKCKTGIANEEVLSDGTHERCGTKVTKKDMWQWVMRITEYADRLLEPVVESLKASDERRVTGDKLDWPRGILEMQKNWIGRKEGAKVKFGVQGSGFRVQAEVFTTRLDTIFGVSFVVVAPEVAKEWMDQGWQAGEEVEQYVEQALRKTERARMQGEKEKTGAKTDLVAVNPVNGEEVPVFVADYVLASVGTGVVMGVPAHDERDWEFAKKYGLEIKVVVLPSLKTKYQQDCFTDDGILVESGKYTGMKSEEARKAILANLQKKGLAEKEVHYHLRDWVFSRQRYWGEPIPLVYCEHCAVNSEKERFQNRLRNTHSPEANEVPNLILEKNGKKYAVVPLKEKDLPLELPYLKSYEPTETGESPLSRVSEWVETTCPVCGGKAYRETDTMPNWAGSCWYFLAFPFWQNGGNEPACAGRRPATSDILQEYKQKYPEQPYTKFWEEVARPAIDKWLPVDWYLGGAEHAVLHLLYARFWVKVFQDMGLVGFSEPFKRLRSVGIVLAEDGRKMSKSWGNVVNPDDVVKEYGADAVRMYEMFMGPWDQSIAWDTRSLVGQKRFLEKVEELILSRNKVGEASDKQLKAKLYDLLSQVERGILTQKFNTSIAGMMELVNEWKRSENKLSREDVGVFLVMLAPFAPGLAEKLWQKLGFEGSVDEQPWPEREKVEIEREVEVVVQVNGKKRASLRMSEAEAKEKERVVELALADEQVRKFVEDEPKRIVFVPGRLVNLVVG